MHSIKTDKKFFERFELLQLRIRELSCLFQNTSAKVSDIELIEWNTIATKLQDDLTRLIEEANIEYIRIK